MANLFYSSVAWAAVTPWAANTAVNVGDIRRQLATPTVGNERCWRCTTANTTGASEPAWTLTQNSTTNDNGVVWTEITGRAIYNGDGGGTAWGAPAARHNVPLAWAAAGDTVLTASNSDDAWTTALTLAATNGTAANPVTFISVDETVVPATNLTTRKDGAIIRTTTGSSGTSGIIRQGFASFFGFIFRSGTGTGSSGIILGAATVASDIADVDCVYDVGSTGTTSRVVIGGAAGGTSSTNQMVRLTNPKVKFATTSGHICLGTGLNSASNLTIDSGSSAPSVLFQYAAGGASVNFRCEGGDISKCTGTLFQGAVGLTHSVDVNISSMKTDANVAKYSGTIAKRGISIVISNCAASATNNQYYSMTYNGIIESDTTYLRTGGASNGVSLKMASSARCHKIMPLVGPWFGRTYPSLDGEVLDTAKTVKVYICGDASLTSADVSLEVEYAGSNATPASTLVSSFAGILAAGTALTASSETWSGSPAAKYELSVSVTPEIAQFLKCRVIVHKPSTTIYVDHKVVVE